MLIVQVVVVVGLVVVAVTYARRHHAVAAGGAGTVDAPHLAPTSTVGKWSMCLLAAAVVLQGALSVVPYVLWAGATFAIASCVMAILAMRRYRDRSSLRWLLIAGLLAALFPILFVVHS
jgi:hypothetical protein